MSTFLAPSMPQHGLGLDHVVLLVADLDAAARPFSEAGFHVGPRGRHPHLGTINRLIMFDGPYVELLSVETPTAANARYRHMLQTLGHGWGLALSAKGVEEAASVLHARGVSTGTPYEGSRPLEDVAGNPLVRFRILPIDTLHSPGGFAFVCQHLTPALVWGDVPVHPNGCRGLSSLSLLGDATAAGAWARTLGLPKQAGGVVGGRLGAVQINVEPAARAGLGLSALVFAGQDGQDGQHGQGRTLRFDVGSDGASGPPADS